MINSHHLVCRVSINPVESATKGGTSVAEFSVAYKDQKKDCFIDVVAYGSIADVVLKHCKKGREVFMHSRLSQNSWDDKKTGKKNRKHFLIVEEIQIGRDLSKKSNEDESNNNDDLPF